MIYSMRIRQRLASKQSTHFRLLAWPAVRVVRPALSWHQTLPIARQLTSSPVIPDTRERSQSLNRPSQNLQSPLANLLLLVSLPLVHPQQTRHITHNPQWHPTPHPRGLKTLLQPTRMLPPPRRLLLVSWAGSGLPSRRRDPTFFFPSRCPLVPVRTPSHPCVATKSPTFMYSCL